MPLAKDTTEGPQGALVADIQGTIEEIARIGAQRLLPRALEGEVEEHLARYEGLHDEGGRQAVVRNRQHDRRIEGYDPIHQD